MIYEIRSMANRFYKLIFFFAIVLFSFCSQDLKQPRQWVYDYESVLDSSQIKQLTSLYINHEKKTTNEIVLVTIRDFFPDSTIEAFSLHTFNKLGIGKKNINNGVLIVFSGANHQVRISTGYGTEKVLTNDIAQHIIDSAMIPHFKNNEAFKGILDGSKAITEFLERPENKIKLP